MEVSLTLNFFLKKAICIVTEEKLILLSCHVSLSRLLSSSLEVLDLSWSYAEDAAVKQFHARMGRRHACLFSQFSIVTVPNVSHLICMNF